MASLFVLGIDITWNQFSGEQANLNIARPMREVSTDNFKRRTIGESGDVNPKYDQVIRVDHQYALKLERCGALVPRREYEMVFDIDLDNPLGGAIVKELIPVDDDIKAHFKNCMK